MTVMPKILIVDDRQENLVALEKLLKELEAECIRASSGNEALALNLEHEFALALIDLQMPGMDGYETAELMRMENKSRLMPIIFVSAIYSGDIYKIKGVEAGAVDFIEKPIAPELLVGKVRLFLEMYRTRRLLSETKDQLMRKEKLAAIGQLAGGVAHDLRNPMNIITNTAFYLNDRLTDFDDEKIRKHLTILQREVDRSNSIISSLIDFARVSHTDHIDGSLNDVIKRVVDHVEIPLGVELVTDLAENLPNISMDPSKLDQVFTNLMTNACQAMENGGRITLSTCVSDRCCEVKVEDTGCGIAPQYLEKVFDPLFTTKFQGIGLGLAIANQIVKRAGGILTVESEIGKGTMFSVELPHSHGHLLERTIA